jgi:hypothetical protein
METKDLRKTNISDVMKTVSPRVKMINSKASHAAVMIAEKMQAAGAAASEKLREHAPDLASIIIVQAAYSLALGVISVIVGESSIAALIIGQLPLVVYGVAKIILRVKK